MSSLASRSPFDAPGATNITANPFDDSMAASAGSEQYLPQRSSTSASTLDPASVLTVDRNATLTLGTDALIVLDEGLKHRRQPRNFCGLLPQLSKTTRAIPFYHVLWAELTDFAITIKFAKGVGRHDKACGVGYVHYALTDKSSHGHAKKWVETLLERAYPPNVQRRKRVKVLVNPFGGQGHAVKLWAREVEPIFAAAKCEVDVERTAYRGHAVEIAEALDVDAYDIVAGASGDGLPHEIFNGLARQKNPRRALKKIAVVQIPCGTGNAMSLNLNGTDSPSWAALAIVKGVPTSLDLVAITQGDQKYFSFLSQAVGIVAESDLGTESLRWMGPLRFTWGFLVRILGQSIYPAEISIATETEDKHEIRQLHRQAMEEHAAASAKGLASPSDTDLSEHDSDSQLPPLRYGTVRDPVPANFTTADHPHLGNFYTGNMPIMSPGVLFFPASLPADGLADLITIPGNVSRFVALRMLTSVEDGTIINFPEVDYRKVTGYRIVPRMAPAIPKGKGKLRWKIGKWLAGASRQKQGLIAVDGESVPFEPFQAEVQKGLATVLSRSGAVYEGLGRRSFDKNLMATL